MWFPSLQPEAVVPRNYSKRVPLKIFYKFTGKPVPSLVFHKVARHRPGAVLEKRLWDKFFPVTFAKCLIAAFLSEPI